MIGITGKNRTQCVAEDASFLARLFGVTPEWAAIGKALREAKRHDGRFPTSPHPRMSVRSRQIRTAQHAAPVQSRWAEEFEILAELFRKERIA